MKQQKLRVADVSCFGFRLRKWTHQLAHKPTHTTTYLSCTHNWVTLHWSSVWESSMNKISSQHVICMRELYPQHSDDILEFLNQEQKKTMTNKRPSFIQSPDYKLVLEMKFCGTVVVEWVAIHLLLWFHTGSHTYTEIPRNAELSLSKKGATFNHSSLLPSVQTIWADCWQIVFI